MCVHVFYDWIAEIDIYVIVYSGGSEMDTGTQAPSPLERDFRKILK